MATERAILNMMKKNFRLMYIDDSPEDIRIVSNVVQKVDGEVVVEPFLSGEEALNNLNKVEDPSHLPDVILLDLNMPGMSGHEVLNKIKNNEKLRKIPVVIFTSSEQPEDVLNSYESQASSVIIKPDELTDYLQLFEEVLNYWKRRVTSPLSVVYRKDDKGPKLN